MKSKMLSRTFLFLTFIISSCEKKEQVTQKPFIVAFEKQSINLSTIQKKEQIKLVFSETAETNGTVVIKVKATNMHYGVDFLIDPSYQNEIIEVPFTKGQQDVNFILESLIHPINSNDKSILLEIIAINYSKESSIQGYVSLLISSGVTLGGTILVDLGGPNQSEQVYIDLSTETITKIKRDSWDFGFYSGEQFRVIINGSIYMAIKKLDQIDIDLVTSLSVASFKSDIAVGTGNPFNINYIDNPNGSINGTAISEISYNEIENNVYLVNMGYEVGTNIPVQGSVDVIGNHRGWKKIRVLRKEKDYVLQYANLDETTHEEIIISKNGAYNFTFFSLNTQNIVNVEPNKDKWDLNFTVFTNEIQGYGSYGYSDFVINNIKGGVKAYKVNTSNYDYEMFSLNNVIENNFSIDQRVIGSDWRDTIDKILYNDRFYILKDSDNNYYKIRMLSFMNESGIRGYSKFEYKLL